MKKRIQKYLSGEKEGFSLVELIIVIAIMAILIGVTALASAVANTQATGADTFKYTGEKTTGTTEKDKVNNEMVDLLGTGSTTLSVDSSAEIYCKYDVDKNIIMVYASTDSGTSAIELDTNETGFGTDLNKTPSGGKGLVVSN